MVLKGPGHDILGSSAACWSKYELNLQVAGTQTARQYWNMRRNIAKLRVKEHPA